MLTEACVRAMETGEDERPTRGSLRLFESGVMEALFRSPPWLPFAYVTPMVGALLERGAARAPAVMLAGALLWAALEYAMHRWLFHVAGTKPVTVGYRFLVHGHHHARPWDGDRLVATPWQFASAAAVLYGAAQLFGEAWDAAFAGSLLAYLAYEAVHYAIHHGRGGPGWLRAVRAHHLRHHHGPEGARSRFGISSPLFDWLLGTRGRPGAAETHTPAPRT
ncbi:MAG: sterol desaturase family protein [Myxococcota bacterium]